MPEYVSSVDEIIQNVLIFDQGKSGSREEKKFCQGRLKNVRHFVALPTGDVHIFAPGNFAMYADNDLIKRFGFGDRSGGEPPRILEEFGTRVGSGDARHHELETEFLAACSGLGIQPSSHPVNAPIGCLFKKMDSQATPKNRMNAKSWTIRI